MSTNIDLDACFELCMQLVNQAGEVSKYLNLNETEMWLRLEA